jgi:hypothetical protein
MWGKMIVLAWRDPAGLAQEKYKRNKERNYSKDN